MGFYDFGFAASTRTYTHIHIHNLKSHLNPIWKHLVSGFATESDTDRHRRARSQPQRARESMIKQTNLCNTHPQFSILLHYLYTLNDALSRSLAPVVVRKLSPFGPSKSGSEMFGFVGIGVQTAEWNTAIPKSNNKRKSGARGRGARVISGEESVRDNTAAAATAAASNGF